MPARLIAARENERKRLAGDLHDSVGQTFAALKFRIEYIVSIMREGRSLDAANLLVEFIPISQRSIDETRAI
ncbi:MAG: histidine kinase [Syntrophobacteraceae bacterium]|nr:histidine kinase [Syntrophobacteraceae bacterium]